MLDDTADTRQPWPRGVKPCMPQAFTLLPLDCNIPLRTGFFVAPTSHLSCTHVLFQTESTYDTLLPFCTLLRKWKCHRHASATHPVWLPTVFVAHPLLFRLVAPLHPLPKYTHLFVGRGIRTCFFSVSLSWDGFRHLPGITQQAFGFSPGGPGQGSTSPAAVGLWLISAVQGQHSQLLRVRPAVVPAPPPPSAFATVTASMMDLLAWVWTNPFHKEYHWIHLRISILYL